MKLTLPVLPGTPYTGEGDVAFVVLVVGVSVVVSGAGVVDDAWRCITCLLEFSSSPTARDKIIVAEK